MQLPRPNWLGRVPYSIALELQNELVEQSLQHEQDALIGLEHPSVITLGKRAEPKDEIKVDLDSLNDLNIQYYKIDRGGHATLHSPGQLVIYPIINLSKYNLSVRDYLCVLQKTTLEFFNKYDIKSYAKENSPGIYTENGKIAFFGIRVTRGVSFHGLAINVCNNTEDFSLIKSCGSNFENFDQMKKHNVNESLEKLFNEWSYIFCRLLNSNK